MRLTLSARGFGELLAATAAALAFLPLLVGGNPVARLWLGAAAALVLLSAFDPAIFTLASRRFSDVLRRWPALRYRLLGVPALVVFVLVIVPVGLLLRVVGRDRIGRRWKPKATSYWEGPARPSVGPMKEPF